MSDITSVPMRKTSGGSSIETRPLHIEEWLDKLPYIDFQKTATLLFDAIKATNQENIKPAVRLELVELYNRPYQYYIDSQIKTGAQHTLQSISSMQSQLAILKKIAVGLGLSCKLAVDEMLKKKTLWGQSKPPLPAMSMSLNYLSHAMIFSFLEYAPIPKNVWQEVNFIYSFARDIGQENNTIVPPGKDAKSRATSIAHDYKKIILASLADPHHLPFGAIWEIYEQLQTWAEFVHLKKFAEPPGPAGFFVINLDKDAAPIPYSKFNRKLASDRHCLIDTTALGKVVQQHLAALQAGHRLDDSLSISPYFANSILSHMSKAWGLPAKRKFPRENRQGNMFLTSGINSSYYFLNGGMDFVPPANGTEDENEIDYLDEMEETIQREYHADEWSLVDKGPGGFAVVKNDKPREAVRVGDLLAVADSPAAKKWKLGIIRWLMIRQNKIYKIGIQMLDRQAFPVAVRACAGSSQETRYHRAFLLQDGKDKSSRAIIMARGMYSNGRELEISYRDKVQQVSASKLLESTVSFEYFSYS